MVKANWFKYYDEVPGEFEFVFQSWDTANKASELNDYSVCTTWGVLKLPRVEGPRRKGQTSGRAARALYLLHVLRKRMEYPELKRTVWTHAAEWSAKNVLIEDRASGTQLIQELKQEGMSSLTRSDSITDKVIRMSSASNLIENGYVYLPERALWLPAYLQELLTFPNCKHDDQADSTSQALNWYKQRAYEPGIIAFYREMMLDDIRSGRRTDFPKECLKYL